MEDFHLDGEAYNELLKLLNNQFNTEKKGGQSDMSFLFEDYWLKDTAVISNVVGRNGMWEVHLVFAHYQEPHRLIKRVISQFPNKKQATISAQYMSRMAAKDQRGTLKVDDQQFKISSN